MTQQANNGGAQDRASMAGESPSSPSSPGRFDQPGGHPPSGVPMSPGDEAPEGTPGTGLDVCPRCGGSGRVGGSECPECEGTGQVNVGIGGA